MAYTFKHGDRPLDGYTVERAVGRGGFGEVYYAVSDGGREVALKYLRENPQVELRGVSHCMNLKSPHLVTIFDVRKNAEGEYFVIMEYVSGPSLRDLLIADPNGLGTQKAAFFVREIAKGLSYLHDRGIVHRDLKPGNIFYDDGYVKIGDYGLSKFISVSRHSAQTVSVGTVHYMAPEIGSGNYSRGVDIYALGVILYEMLLGKVPFEGSSMGEVLMKHLTEQPEVVALPVPFGEVIRRALAKDPYDRYQSVDEMVERIMGVDVLRESAAGFDHQSLSVAVEQLAAARMEANSPLPGPLPPPPGQPAAARAAANGVNTPGLDREVVPGGFMRPAGAVYHGTPVASYGFEYWPH
jgi:serine/threonine protein kinase